MTEGADETRDTRSIERFSKSALGLMCLAVSVGPSDPSGHLPPCVKTGENRSGHWARSLDGSTGLAGAFMCEFRDEMQAVFE